LTCTPPAENVGGDAAREADIDNQTPPATPLSIVGLANTYEAFGMVINFLSVSLPFSHFELGQFAGIIRDQLVQGHNLAAITDANEMVGYVGWLHTSQANAELWSNDMGPLRAVTDGTHDAAALTVVAASEQQATLRLIRGARTLHKGMRVYFKRGYDGQVRPARKASVLNFG